jgi:hypothetical protein
MEFLGWQRPLLRRLFRAVTPDEDRWLSDEGCLTDLADLLNRRGRGSLRALTGGLFGLGFLVFYLFFTDDHRPVIPIAILTSWCFFGAWFVKRFSSTTQKRKH